MANRILVDLGVFLSHYRCPLFSDHLLSLRVTSHHTLSERLANIKSTHPQHCAIPHINNLPDCLFASLFLMEGNGVYVRQAIAL